MLVVLGALASFFSLSSTVPQTLRALRTRSADGVSWNGVLLNLGSTALWWTYAAAVMDHVQLVYNTMALGLLVVLTVALLVVGARGWWSGAVAAATATIVSVGAAVAVVEASNPFALAMAGTVASSLKMWPQTRLALGGSPMWGLDPWATALGWVGWLLWTVYAVAAGDHALALCSFSGLVLQSTVTAFRLPPRRTLHSIAGGRLGPVVARAASPVSGRFPLRAGDYELVA